MSASRTDPAPATVPATTHAARATTARERRRVRLKAWREAFRSRLAHADSIVGLSALALLAGLLTGALIIVFRLVTERALVWAGILDRVENYEGLDWAWRLGLPIGGGLAIGMLMQLLPVAARQVGPVHVMAGLAKQGGRLPWQNAIAQFVGGTLSILSGHSVGREGPVIHVGAATASLLGQWLRLPNNSIRTLVACGVAGSIAASFNTPIAGVVFAMEVVMFEYTLTGFAPVIIAAVSATSISRMAFGSAPAFSVPTFHLASLLELPWVILLGLIVGVFAATYVHGIVFIDRRSRGFPLWVRTTLAGTIVGACAIPVPEVMGLGYDTVQAAMTGDLALTLLAMIVLAKLVATIACGGLGLPGGLIGPMVVIGASIGGALGIIGQMLVPDASAPPAFYATLGVAAMMGACLQAPLAALMAILELTANSNTILPGMAAVITAFLTSRVVFRQKPIFVALLAERGIEYQVDPVALGLERIGVRAVMSQRYVVVRIDTAPEEIARMLRPSHEWVIVVEGREIRGVVPRKMLGSINDSKASEKVDSTSSVSDDPVAAANPAPEPPEPAIALPDKLLLFTPVLPHATLGEALAGLDRDGLDIALIADSPTPRIDQLRGVLSRRQIESSVRYRT